MNGPGTFARVALGAILVAVATPAAAPAQESGPLLKSDLVRMMTASNYTATEMAAIVRMNCVGFEPTARDRNQLGNLPNADIVLAEVDRCMSRPRTASRARSVQRPSPQPVRRAPPRPKGDIDLTGLAMNDGVAPSVELERPDGAAGAAGPETPDSPRERETPPRLVNWKQVSSAFLREYRPNVRQPGTVLLWLRVSPEGTVAESRVKQATGDPDMVEAALAITDVMVFEPATLRDRPVESWTELPINFSSK